MLKSLNYLYLFFDSVEEKTCSNEEFTCKNGEGQCIPMNWVCDQHPDCVDKSDEAACSKCINFFFNADYFLHPRFD